MKAKLIKTIDGYHLRSLIKDIPRSINVYHKINETEGEFGFGEHSGKLSKQNCEAIANGYDVYELAKENYHKFWPIIDESGLINHTFGYVEGFNKAMELNKDKLFTLEDMMNCWNKALTFQNHKELFGYHIQSLQQNEWGVEIVMEDIIHLKNRRGGLANMGKPKLDSSGNLILKKI